MKLPNDPEIVEMLRALQRRGEPSAAMLRVLDGRGLSTPQMMSHFREAFDLDFDDVSCIGGWFADGSGELSDEAITARLGPTVTVKTRGAHRPEARS